MISEDIPISFSVTPGKSYSPEIVEYRDKFRKKEPENQSFEELLANIVKKHFLRACKRMMPLVETFPISSININLDISGSCTSILATYESGMSDASIGKYLFTAKPALIVDYLSNYFSETIPLGSSTYYTWEHELIHMLDHINTSELDYNREQPDVTEVLVKFILSFRSEGIAELFYFMKNHSKYRSIKAARTVFLKHMEFLRNRPWDNPRFVKVAHQVIKGDHDYYTIGTWMVFHVMGCSAYKKMNAEAKLVGIKIKKRQEMTDEEIIGMVRWALEIDNYIFIDCLTKPGPDGKPFVAFDEMYDLARHIEICKANLYRKLRQPAQISGDPKIVSLFRLLRPKAQPS
jgi:hypothetical protein